MESVLTSIKKMLGITEEYEHFDSDIIMHINSVFMILTQLGVGPPSGFFIQDKTSTWKEFISDETKLQLVKSYMHMKVKLLFDPPLSSAVIASMEKMIAEADYRLYQDLEQFTSIVVNIKDCKAFEEDNTIINPNGYFKSREYYKIQKEFFITAVKKGQETARKMILKKYPGL